MRDEKLFRYLFVNKIATVEDIRRDVFGNISPKTVHRRLVKLSCKGFIEASGQRERGNRMLYFLSKKGFRTYIADDRALKRVQLKSDAVSHDLALLEIKRRFNNFEMIQGFYSENLIRSGILDDTPMIKRLKEIRPDAIVKIKMNEKILFLPLEYEASSKYSRRNEKLLSKYYTCPDAMAILFISKTDTIEKRIRHKEQARISQRKGKIYYVLLENVTNAKEKLTLTNIKKEVLLIS